MFDFDASFAELLKMFQHYQVRVEEFDKERRKGGCRTAMIQADIDSAREAILRELKGMLRYPPHHAGHKAQLDAFLKEGPYEDSVFIMTKFPDAKGDAKLNQELVAVISAVQDAVKARGYRPRLASENAYHPMLWPNVEIHLLGCARGVAIVEDRYQAEFNPNVALEWGWMRAMGKPVLFLVEEGFNHGRADSLGFLDDKFPWSAPTPAISAAVNRWLQPRH